MNATGEHGANPRQPDEVTAAELYLPIPRVQADTAAGDVLLAFHRSEASAMAVFAGQGLVGVITRDAWMERFSGPYALPLYGRHHVSRFASPFATISEQLKLTEVARVALNRPDSERQLPLAVCRDDQFLGMIDYHQLVEALLAAGDRALEAQLLAERELRKLQRLESLGLLAGGISHDFNNILASIMGNVGLIKMSSLSIEQREALGQVELAARRAGDLTGRLLAFARGGIARFAPVDLREVIAETMSLAEPAFSSRIERRLDVPEFPVIVEGSEGQLQQAILNIILNARDAMIDSGLLAVTLRQREKDAELTIRDSGPGMDSSTRERLFEPFFTTKPIGQGTGLGLAVSFGIVRGHGGEIHVESSIGHGSAFVVTLPLAREHLTAPVCPGQTGPGARLMIVDDEPMLRRATAQLLRAAGYDVVETASGDEAVTTLLSSPDSIGLVLLDLVMPGMDGRETYEALAAIRPRIPVIIWTGFALDEHLPIEMKRQVALILQKPVSGERLLEEVARHLAPPLADIDASGVALSADQDW